MTRRRLPDSKKSPSEATLRFAMRFLAFLVIVGVILLVVALITA